MPYGEPGAYWLLLGPNVEFPHTPYDLAKAAKRIRDTNYPQAEDFAAHGGLRRPSEGGMREKFSSQIYPSGIDIESGTASRKIFGFSLDWRLQPHILCVPR
jgi:hypothetical protein